MKISELIDNIKSHDLVLPEFQREYVWTLDQAKQLLSSLFKEYPVGSLLFWKTDAPPELKNVAEIPQRLGNIEIILDGQQRLTTLYMLLEGTIPPYYTEAEIQNDPRELYFNIEDGDFQYYLQSRMKDNPVWHRVVDCFTNREINVFEIAQRQVESGDEAFQLARRYNDNLNKLRQIAAANMPVQVVPPSADIVQAIDIFDLVNSQGTKLTDADLALTHITGKWPQARRVMKAKLDEWATRHFDFDLTFTTRALTSVVAKKALFEQIHDRSKDDLMEGWDRVVETVDYMIAILPNRAYIHSTEDLNSTNTLIPLVAYLAQHGAHFGDEASLKQAVRWLYLAHVWARYTSQTDQRLDKDVQLAVQQPKPWAALCDEIIDQRGRLAVNASDFEGRGTLHPLYRMTYILAKTHDAFDWFSGVPLGVVVGRNYHIHNHQIFSQTLLYRNGYDSDNHLHRKVVNEIANQAFVTSNPGREIDRKPPSEYLAEIADRRPDALTKQFIPIDPNLWRIENYEEFLDARRKLLARKLNEYLDTLMAGPEVRRTVPVAELIALGESTSVEFKSTFQWDVVRNSANPDLRLMTVKTIAAFLNTEGGTLLIGVEDDGLIYGLANDLRNVNRHNLDGFQQALVQHVSEALGGDYVRLVKIRFEPVDGKDICVVEVDPAAAPVFVSRTQGALVTREFYVRAGNTTRSLDSEAAHRYIQDHWA